MPPRIGGLQFAPGSRAPAKAKPKPAPVAVHIPASLNLSGASPLAAPIEAHRQKLKQTAQSLPGKPSLSEVSHGYDQAVIHTFEHQPKKVQQRILRNAVKTKTPEGDLLLKHAGVKSSEKLRQVLDVAQEMGSHKSPFGEVGSALGDLGAELKRGLTPYSPGQVGEALASPSYASSAEGLKNPALAGMSRTQGALEGVSALLSKGVAAGEQRGVLGGPKTKTAGFDGGTIALHALEDAANLPREAIPGLAIPGSQALSGDVKGALKTVGTPYADALMHPKRAITDYPLNTFLLASGAEGALGRSLGAAARSDLTPKALSRIASTKRAPLELAPGQTEARHYSPDLLRKGAQVAGERRRARRGENPNAARPVPEMLDNRVVQALGVGQHAKLNRIVDEMSGVHQLSSRENRVLVKQARHAGMPTRNGRRAPEADVVSLAAQRVLRTPATFAADLVKERNRLESAYRAHNLQGTVEGKQNRLQVRDIDKVLRDPRALANAKGVFDSAQSYIHDMNEVDKEAGARGAIDPGRAEKSAYFPYAIAHMDAKYDPAKGLVTAKGDPLTLDAIKADMEANEVSAPAYLQHQLNTSGSGSFYKPYRLTRARTGTKVRTGRSFQTGAYEHTYDALVGQNAKSAGILDRLKLHDKLVNRAGIGRPDLRELLDERPSVTEAKQDPYFTPREAKLVAYRYSHDDNHNEIPGRVELVPVTAFAKRGSSDTQLRAIAEEQHPNQLGARDDLEAQGLKNAQEDAAVRDDGIRNVVLVPETQVNRFLNNYKGASAGAKAIGSFTQQFRRTVLPYSVHWGTQNVTEGMLRGLIRSSFNPLSAANHIRIARKFFQQSLVTDVAKARDLKLEAIGGTLYNAHDPLARHNPNPGYLRALGQNNPVLRHTVTPVARSIAWAHNTYADHIGAAMAFLERGFRHIAVGKKVQRDLQEFSDSWIKSVHASGELMQKIVDNHHVDPAQAAELGRYVDDAFGKYSKLGPATRGLVQSIAPFATWYINAVKWVYWTLPAEHPVKMSVLASAETTLAQDMKDGKKLPLSANVAEQLGRLTPFGIATGGKDTVDAIEQGVTSSFLPQIMGAYNVLQGHNVFGDGPLYGPHGEVTDSGTRGLLALYALTEGILPGLSIARTVREGGKRAYGTSTALKPQTKPGPGYGVANKLLNPFHSFAPPGGGSGGGVPGGGGVPTGGGIPGGGGVPSGGGVPR